MAEVAYYLQRTMLDNRVLCYRYGLMPRNWANIVANRNIRFAGIYKFLSVPESCVIRVIGRAAMERGDPSYDWLLQWPMGVE